MPNTDNSNETSGTPGYMAPEVMCKNNHGIAADYFAVGVIAWECMFGRRPYQGKSRKEIRDAILQKEAHIRKNEVPEGWDVEAADFINKVSIPPSIRGHFEICLHLSGHIEYSDKFIGQSCLSCTFLHPMGPF